VKTVESKLLEEMRRQLHTAVDEIVDRLSALPSAISETGQTNVVPGPAFEVWRYKWPDGQVEEFTSGRWYHVGGPEGSIRLRLGWTTRKAWGRDRRRAIVFHEVGDGGLTWYPLAEFVETDDSGLLASPIPDPDRPRALLSNGAELPTRFRDATVVRADSVFRTIENGPSLRLLVRQEDEIEMVRHAHWVAGVRGRIKGKMT